MDHTTPRAVIVQPPSDVILPPERAVVDLIESAAVVVNVGRVVGEVLAESLRQLPHLSFLLE